MQILQIAGVTFGFVSQLPIRFIKEMEQFAVSADTQCDYIYEAIAAPLPAMPAEPAAIDGGSKKKWCLPNRTLTYYQSERRQWNYCMEETPEKTKIYLLPEFVHEMDDVWNLFGKIEFSSRLLEHGAVMLHSSYLIYDGQAILFTAASGVGKSTQAELWRKTLGAEVINGDRSIIREKDGRLWAFGTPYSGTSGICKNVSAPIRAIVTLEQAPENTIRTLTRKECTRFFLAQTTIQRWKPEDVIGTIELWDNFITKVPVLRLACRPDEDAVYTLKNYLDALDKEEKPL